MRRTRVLAALVISLLATLFLPVSARAGEGNTWTSETTGVTIDFDTLEVDTDVAFPSDEVTVSLACEGERVTKIAVTFSNYNGYSRFITVELTDPDEDGVFEGTFPVVDSMRDGTWQGNKVEVYSGDELVVRMYDSYGHGVHGCQADLSRVKFEVSGTTSDTTAPILDPDSLAAEPKEARAGDTVVLTLRAMDDYSLTGPGAYIKYEVYANGWHYLTFTDPEGDGTFTATLEVTKDTQMGEWRPEKLEVYDDAENHTVYVDTAQSTFYNGPEVIDMSGLAFTVLGAGDETDVTPPVIDLSTACIIADQEPAVRGDSVIASVRVTDDTGVAQVQGHLIHDGSTERTINFVDKGDGIWQAVIPLDYSYGVGQWGLHGITAVDVNGNKDGVCAEGSYYAESYYGYTVTDLSAFDFKVVESAGEPNFVIDWDSVTVTPNPAEAGVSATISMRVTGDKAPDYADLYYRDDTNHEWLNCILSYDKDSGLLVGDYAIYRNWKPATCQARYLRIYASDRSCTTYVAPWDDTEGIEHDLTAFDIDIAEATSDHRPKPDATTMRATPSVVRAGDTVTFSVKITGDQRVRYAHLYVTTSEGYNQTDVRLSSRDGETFTGTLEITDSMPLGDWCVEHIRVEDASWAAYEVYNKSQGGSADLSGGNFTIERDPSLPDDPEADTEPPYLLLEKSYVLPTNPTPKSPFDLRVYVADDGSGVASKGCEINYGGPSHSVGLIVNLYDGEYLGWNSVSLDVGYNQVRYIKLVDNAGNAVYVVNSNWEGGERLGYKPKIFADLSSLDVTVVEATDKNMDSATVTVAPGSVYDGTEKTPEVTVTLGDAELVEGRDYELAWRDNVQSGTATVWVMGIGEYVGAKSATFKIAKIDISGAVVDPIPDQQYDGGHGPQPDVRVTLDGVELVRGQDYDVHYSRNQVVGTARAAIVGINNCKGIVYAPFEVLPMDISGGTVTAPEGIRDDEELGADDIFVLVDGKELVARKDYVVTFEKSLEEGVARLTVTGVRACTGTIEHTVRLIRTIDSATVTAPDQVYAGVPLYPEVTVEFEGRTLEGGLDYEIVMADNVEPGIATVRVYGVGNYAGEASCTFQIDEPFCDVTAATPHHGDILWMYASGVSRGWREYPVREYRPTSTVKRQDMAAFLYRMAGSPAYTPTAEDMARFTDVTTSTPHCREIWWLASAGISTGWVMKDGTCEFRPAGTVKRQDMAAFLYRLAGSPAFTPSDADRARFTDVTTSTPHHDEVWWLASTGVTTGFSDGTFRGMNNIIRQDMAAFLHRMADKALVKY